MNAREHAGLRARNVLDERDSVSARDGPRVESDKVPEMGSVVASVTGYSGDERSKLIKLINGSGANYVGKLLKGSTTHLVCWTFHGPKYEMAKRFGIHILNHRWFEDCFKAGKRLDESPYATLSGKEIGAVSWKPPDPESFSSKHGKWEVPKSPPKYAHIEGCHQRRGEVLSKAAPYYHHDSLSATLSEEILNVSDDDHDLEILLQNKRRGKGKRKASMVLKNPILLHKTAPKKTEKSIVSPIHERQRKHGHTRSTVTHSILEYAHLTGDIEIKDDQRSPARARRQSLQLEEIEDSYETPFARVANCWEQKSSTILDSMRHRKKCRLLRKAEATEVHNSCGMMVVGTNDMAQAPKQSKPTPRGEVIHDEPACSKSPNFADVSFSRAFEDLSGSPVACTLVPADIACVICHTDAITSAEGVLTCGHHFCYQCIMKWASEVASKTPTCPLCKAPFDMITKREQIPGSGDEEVSYEESVVMLGQVEKCSVEQLGESTPIPSCILCGIGDMEELLLTCTGCGTRSAHSFCLDPPLPPLPDAPWFCGRCSQRRRADITWWHQLHLFEC